MADFLSGAVLIRGGQSRRQDYFGLGRGVAGSAGGVGSNSDRPAVAEVVSGQVVYEDDLASPVGVYASTFLLDVGGVGSAASTVVRRYLTLHVKAGAHRCLTERDAAHEPGDAPRPALSGEHWVGRRRAEREPGDVGRLADPDAVGLLPEIPRAGTAVDLACCMLRAPEQARSGQISA